MKPGVSLWFSLSVRKYRMGKDCEAAYVTLFGCNKLVLASWQVSIPMKLVKQQQGAVCASPYYSFSGQPCNF